MAIKQINWEEIGKNKLYRNLVESFPSFIIDWLLEKQKYTLEELNQATWFENDCNGIGFRMEEVNENGYVSEYYWEWAFYMDYGANIKASEEIFDFCEWNGDDAVDYCQKNFSDQIKQLIDKKGKVDSDALADAVIDAGRRGDFISYTDGVEYDIGFGWYGYNTFDYTRHPSTW